MMVEKLLFSLYLRMKHTLAQRFVGRLGYKNRREVWLRRGGALDDAGRVFVSVSSLKQLTQSYVFIE